MLFRFHRGTLADSMKTVIEVNSLEELRAAIGTHMNPYKLGPLKFTYQCFDDRINWQSWLVSEVTDEYPQGCAIGHANGVFDAIAYSKTPYLRDIIADLDAPGSGEVVIMKGAAIGATEGLTNNSAFLLSHLPPISQREDEKDEDFKTRLKQQYNL